MSPPTLWYTLSYSSLVCLVEGDKGIMNDHHTSSNVMQTEGTNEMDGIQIIKLGDSSPQVNI